MCKFDLVCVFYVLYMWVMCLFMCVYFVVDF